MLRKLICPLIWFTLALQGRAAEQISQETKRAADEASDTWSAFTPSLDKFDEKAFFDLRSLNHTRAGEEGFVVRLEDELVFSESKQPVRFWGVDLKVEFDSKSSADRIARHLAKRGVNLVRLQTPLAAAKITKRPTIQKSRLNQLHYWVYTLAKQGIYSELSFFSPRWHEMNSWEAFPGYDLELAKHPFGLLFFHPEFQTYYRQWLKQLLTTRNPYTGMTLAEDPALAILELCNEDNLFSWTFKPYQSIPGHAMRPLELSFGNWLKQKYSSLEEASHAWGAPANPVRGDNIPAGRAGLYQAAMLTSEAWAKAGRNPRRASDQAAFLYHLQRRFHRETIRYLRQELHLQCTILAGNGLTADDSILSGIDKHSQFDGDILASSDPRGLQRAADPSFPLRIGESYKDTSWLRHPVNSPINQSQYHGFPHIVCHYGTPAPSRFRGESPVIAAAYGSLLGTDAFIHFAHPGKSWQATLTASGIALPSLIGQFPACSLIFRKGLLRKAPPAYSVEESIDNLFKLNGSPACQADSSKAPQNPQPGDPLTLRERGYDPFSTLVGPVEITLTEKRSSRAIRRIPEGAIDRDAKLITSATGEILLDYGHGLLRFNAPHAQGICGFPGKQFHSTSNLSLHSETEFLSVITVSLDSAPIGTSQKILLQVSTEERPTDWKTNSSGPKQKIIKLGRSPLLTRDPSALFELRHSRATELQIQALDTNGMPLSEVEALEQQDQRLRFKLRPGIFYYAIHIPDQP